MKSLSETPFTHIQIYTLVNTFLSSIVETLADPLSLYMFFMELLCLATLFIAGLIILVEKEHYSLCFSCLGTAAYFYPCCYVNEKIADKLSEVSEALYNLPWWHLTTKDRRTLLMTLNCGFLSAGYTAGGVHDLTIEQFSTVVQAAYSNCLVLKDY